jgi:4-amino-4-deoxy-L-arabinose transferase-like glycosyltransferase
MSPGFRRMLLALLWLALAAFSGFGLDAPLGDGDESMHAEMLREMQRSGDYLHSRWYGVALWERPLAMYWLAAPFAALIPGEPGLRAGAALASLLTLWVLWRFASQRWGPAAAASGVLLLAAAPSYHDFSRRLLSEGPYVLALTLALIGTIRAQSERAGLWLAAFGLGLATALKSLAVAVPALALAPWLWIAARAHADRRTLAGALALFGALALPYYALGFALDPQQFWREHILFHLWQRARGGFVGMGGGVLAYVQWLPRSDGPFIALWLACACPAACWFGRRDRALAIAGSYALATFAGMSLLGTRLPHYVLPIFPAAALASAGLVALAAERIVQARLLAVTAPPLLALSIGLLSWPYPGARDSLFERPWSKPLGLAARKLTAAGETLYVYEWYGLALGYYAERPIVLLTARAERFAAIDFEGGAIHRAGLARKVPPAPGAAGDRIVLAGHVQTLSEAGWFKVSDVLAAAPPYFLVRAEIAAPAALSSRAER